LISIDAVLEHGSEKHRQMALEHLLEGLLEFATDEQGSKSVVKALKEDEKKRLNRVVQRMCDLAKGCVALSPFSLLYRYLSLS
jgi:predicted PP-loop superfamily ATPase